MLLEYIHNGLLQPFEWRLLHVCEELIKVRTAQGRVLEGMKGIFTKIPEYAELSGFDAVERGVSRRQLLDLAVDGIKLVVKKQRWVERIVGKVRRAQLGFKREAPSEGDEDRVQVD